MKGSLSVRGSGADLDVDKREEEEGDTRAARQQRPRPMLTLLQPFLCGGKHIHYVKIRI